MSNWQFFISLVKGYAPYFRFPKVFILETRDDDNFLKAHKQAWAYYDPDMEAGVMIRRSDSRLWSWWGSVRVRGCRVGNPARSD